MFRLMMLLYSIASVTLAGIAIIVVLAAGYGTTKPIIAAAVAGFLVAVPVAWAVAKKLSSLR